MAERLAAEKLAARIAELEQLPAHIPAVDLPVCALLCLAPPHYDGASLIANPVPFRLHGSSRHLINEPMLSDSHRTSSCGRSLS